MSADRKALLDGALDAIAAVDQALADYASDDEGMSAAFNRLDAVMGLGPKQDLRKKAVASIDSWFLNRVRGKRPPFPVLLHIVSDDGKWSQDPSEPEQKLWPPLYPIPLGVDGVVEYRTFVPGSGQNGFVPPPSGSGEWIFDDLIKVES